MVVNMPGSVVAKGMRVGIISDTHGLMRPEAIAALRGSDLIVHAGDIGRLEVLEQLRDLAPTHAVRGNIDIQPWARKLPDTAVVRAGVNVSSCSMTSRNWTLILSVQGMAPSCSVIRIAPRRRAGTACCSSILEVPARAGSLCRSRWRGFK
jgi:hypothetical protein